MRSFIKELDKLVVKRAIFLGILGPSIVSLILFTASN